MKELKQIRGRHTELVSVYVPPGYNLNEVTSQIATEQGTATNIKSKTTRKNVLTALERTAQKLKLYKQTPANGLIVFCGNVAENDSYDDVQIWDIEPPEPINQRLYRCDSTFVLEPIEHLIREKEVYGLITLDTKHASVALLSGRRITVLKDWESMVFGKFGKGGQSAQRFERVRDGLILNFEKQIGEVATNFFKNEKDLIGIIVGGPGPLKEDFAANDFLSQDLKKKIIAVKDIGYAGSDGLKELVERSEDVLKESAIMKEKLLLQKFLEHLKKDTGRVTYGYTSVMNALKLGAVETIIVSEAFKLPESFKAEFPSHIDFFEALAEKAAETSSVLEIVSEDTPEGMQFLQLGGIAALLRYKIE